MSKSSREHRAASKELNQYLDEITKLCSRLNEIYKFEEKAGLNVRSKFEHYKKDANDLEEYERELKNLVDHIQRFENSVGSEPSEFIVKLERYLYSISMQQIGEKGVRPQHLFIKEAKVYSEKGENDLAEKLKNEAFETLEILEKLNEIVLKLINETEKSPELQTDTRNKLSQLEERKSETEEIIEEIEKEKKRTQNRYEELIKQSNF